MRKIGIFTGTRAEYGLLYWLLNDANNDPEIELQLLVSGSHLSPEFGYTQKQILSDGFVITESVEMLLSTNTPIGTAKSVGLGVIGYADALARMMPDVLVILGDRFEALAVAQAAMFLRIPIAHIHGGEVTEGAYDDLIRHAISKLSFLHFTSTEQHRHRVIQLGEEPERVFNTGAVGLDHLQRTALLSISDLGRAIDFELHLPYFLVTYHPVTLANEPATNSFSAILSALERYPNHQLIITYPNADDGGRQLIPLIEAYTKSNPARVCAINSLGQQRYLSAVSNAAAVIGNSSSGIIEVPSFGIPTINIGHRQKGRAAASSVINCAPTVESIDTAIKQAIKVNLEGVKNPYGSGDVSGRILHILKRFDLSLTKKFYDIN